ncbi:hypothetical protein [Thermomonospora amylolytica]|uniref:hypothetical protein n=1 Tax=Thermomonospora amylolytica TaxID=1411117 RepID=UPI00130017F1|nr:hypothetical protein [Thermomonospora amylolytica]
MRKHMITVGITSAALGGGLLAAPSALAQESSGSTAVRAAAVQTQQSGTQAQRPRCKVRHIRIYRHGKRVSIKIKVCVKRRHDRKDRFFDRDRFDRDRYDRDRY